MRNGLPRLRLRIARTYKQGKVKINNKNQLMEKRGQEITCSCSNLKVNKVYLILGKEDKRTRVLYLDNFSTALEWNKNGKSYVKAFRNRSSCPERRMPQINGKRNFYRFQNRTFAHFRKTLFRNCSRKVKCLLSLSSKYRN